MFHDLHLIQPTAPVPISAKTAKPRKILSVKVEYVKILYPTCQQKDGLWPTEQLTA
jgi:hypothetical protein